MSFQQNGGKRFNLGELFIVVIVVGILSAIAIPRFVQSSGKSKKIEAVMILKQLQQKERMVFQEFDRYVAGTETEDLVNSLLGFEDPGPDAGYTYSVKLDSTGFTVFATEKDDADDDGIPKEVLTIDQDGRTLGDWPE